MNQKLEVGKALACLDCSKSSEIIQEKNKCIAIEAMAQ